MGNLSCSLALGKQHQPGSKGLHLMGSKKLERENVLCHHPHPFGGHREQDPSWKAVWGLLCWQRPQWDSSSLLAITKPLVVALEPA